ncbi:hypothetical protein B484DRAFT_446499 [Ochromonadaceae sp. CCMP2298]|nr:hypothetical protein B484DRAFT_446499 [Ochromonadaceae sp. CCMP2298]
MPPFLLLLLLFILGQASSSPFLKGNKEVDGMRESLRKSSQDRNVSSEDNVCSGITSVTCPTCLSEGFNGSSSSLESSQEYDDYDYAYCVDPQFCFLLDGSDSADDCKTICSGGYHLKDDTNKCEDFSYTISAVIVSLILFICCPCMFICGLCYIFYQRCAVTLGSKVHVEPRPNHNPVPMLQVVQFNEQGHEQYVPTDSRLAPASSSQFNAHLAQPTAEPCYALIHSAAVVGEHGGTVAQSPHARAVAVAYSY